MDVFNIKELNFSVVSLGQSDQDTARDLLSPFSFIDFINYLQTEYAPENYSSFYSYYLKQWYSKQTESKDEQKQLYKDYYRQFIQEIILKYTTETEKRFLSKVNYDDPRDLDIIIPFYANKLTEIATFYKNKREEGKYVIDKNKIKGSAVGVERAIFDNVYNYIINTGEVSEKFGDSLSSTIKDFNINIQEYIDVYGDYFDLPRTDKDEDNIRKSLYDNNLVNIDSSYYFDPEALDVLRSNPTIRLIDNININPQPFNQNDITSFCNPENSIVEDLNENFTVGGLTPGDVYDLKKQLISKYVSSDFYYINTANNTTGILFRSDQPAVNLLSLYTPDVAVVQSSQQKILRDVGLFFQPDDFGIFKLNAVKGTYELDETKLEDDKIYIFPDPSVYGNVGVNSLSSYPYVYSFDFRDNIRNVSSGAAIGDPKITNKNLTIEPYSTKQRESQELSNLNTLGYNLNFSDLYNIGTVRKTAYDYFGNEYAMFKVDRMEDRINLTPQVDVEGSVNTTILATNNSLSGESTNVGRVTQPGNLFIKYQGTSLSYPSSVAFKNILSKYSVEVNSDIESNLIDFDVIKDSIFFETHSRLIIDKIRYSRENIFERPNTSNTIFNVSSGDALNVFSNRLFIDSFEACNGNGVVLFAIFKVNTTDTSTLPSNYWSIYPEIYQYNITENKTEKIFPQTPGQSDLISFKTSFASLSTNFAPEKIKTPKVVFNSMRKKLKLSYILLDQNNFSHIHDCMFEWKSGVLTLNRVVRYTPYDLTLRTTTFGSSTMFATINKNSTNGYVVEQNKLYI